MMRSFDFVFPGTPNLPSNIHATTPEITATAQFIRSHFTDAADGLLNVLGIQASESAIVSPLGGGQAAGGSDAPALPSVAAREEVAA